MPSAAEDYIGLGKQLLARHLSPGRYRTPAQGSSSDHKDKIIWPEPGSIRLISQAGPDALYYGTSRSGKCRADGHK